MMKKKSGLCGLMTALCLVLLFGLTACGAEPAELAAYGEKIELLRTQAVTEDIQSELGSVPAGEVGHVVMISVCDTTRRASVFTGVGADLASAWEAADQAARSGLKAAPIDPQWVKADVVYVSEKISADELAKAIYASRHEFFRYGLAFDDGYATALLEAELNGAKIYEYEKGGVDLSYLNTYLKKAGREPLEKLPEEYTVFQTFGWFCDEMNAVYLLDSTGLDYGRRQVEVLDADYARDLIGKASDFLVKQVKQDGSFVYGMYPRFDNDIENYNIVRHASTIWSLICRYRMDPSEELAHVIESTIDYMLTQVVQENETTAHLYEIKDDEIKLGANGVAVIAMTEYMDVFESDKYVDICRKLGNGILTMLDRETGVYYHVLNGDFSRKEEFRTVYYDGEATFALCRLYSLTGEQVWLDAARCAVDHFIEADYTQYKDHWVAYSMNEITKHITDNTEYYAFALRNVQVNAAEIYERDTTYHTYLELLMSTFELYDRLMERGAGVEGFDLDAFLETIYTRADRQLNGFFYPEYAMYMANPQRVLNTFMVRHDGYRIRIDDVQHNIGGYYLYYKNYDKLVEYGMLDCVD